MSNPDPIRLLLIEDSAVDAMFVTRLLESNPRATFEVDHATTLADASLLLQKISFDACLLDLHLPDATELEAFEQIRAFDARIPIVVLTGSDDESLALKAIENGAQEVMAKGHVTVQMLFRAVRFAIARQLKVMGYKADADTDPLTGMPNRRQLESQFVDLQAMAKQQGVPMTLALFDDDHFKIINDEYGHFIGDAVLKEIANLLLGSIPEGTLASRFGGEEFALLMPGSDLDEGATLVQNILNQLESRVMIFDSLTITVTASAGLIIVQDDASWDSSYIACDDALYDAKTSGRNCLIINSRVPHADSIRS
ncbi:GGDEF domain-containing response regulator [Rhodopirellula sp.]|nr:GGDEF domain-containing response regulator [Rhodopirellula sp.]